MLHATVDHPALTVLLMTSTRWHTAAVSLPPSLYHAWNENLTFQFLTTFHVHVQLNGLRVWRDLRPPSGRLKCFWISLNSESSQVIQPERGHRSWVGGQNFLASIALNKLASSMRGFSPPPLDSPS